MEFMAETEEEEEAAKVMTRAERKINFIFVLLWKEVFFLGKIKGKIKKGKTFVVLGEESFLLSRCVWKDSKVRKKKEKMNDNKNHTHTHTPQKICLH